MIVRAKPPPSSIADAIEYASPLTNDIRLREEEKEAIAWLVRWAKDSTPSKRWVGTTDPTAEDT